MIGTDAVKPQNKSVALDGRLMSLLEPTAVTGTILFNGTDEMSANLVTNISIAVSLKRIADALDKKE